MKKDVHAGITIAFGLGLLAVTQMDGYVDKLLKRYVSPTSSLPDALAPILAGLGIFVILLGLAWRLFPTRVLQGLTSDFHCLTAKREDLTQIYQMAREHFGEGVSSIPTMKRWYDKNSQLFCILYKVRTAGFQQTREMVGYYCVIPLIESAAQRIASGELRVTGLQPTDIEKPGVACSAIYIGAIVGTTRLARGNILSIFHRELTGHLAKQTQEFFTRPVTADGLRIVQKYKFLPAELNAAGGIDALYTLKSDA